MDGDRVQAAITKTAVLESRLDGHEDVCAKRYGEIAAAFSAVHGQLEGINGNLRNALIAVIVFLVGALGTLAYQGFPWEKRVEQVRE